MIEVRIVGKELKYGDMMDGLHKVLTEDKAAKEFIAKYPFMELAFQAIISKVEDVLWRD